MLLPRFYVLFPTMMLLLASFPYSSEAQQQQQQQQQQEKEIRRILSKEKEVFTSAKPIPDEPENYLSSYFDIVFLTTFDTEALGPTDVTELMDAVQDLQTAYNDLILQCEKPENKKMENVELVKFHLIQSSATIAVPDDNRRRLLKGGSRSTSSTLNMMSSSRQLNGAMPNLLTQVFASGTCSHCTVRPAVMNEANVITNSDFTMSGRRRRLRRSSYDENIHIIPDNHSSRESNNNIYHNMDRSLNELIEVCPTEAQLMEKFSMVLKNNQSLRHITDVTYLDEFDDDDEGIDTTAVMKKDKSKKRDSTKKIKHPKRKSEKSSKKSVQGEKKKVKRDPTKKKLKKKKEKSS